MTVRVKLAETPTEIRDVARVRHQVYVEEDGYLPPRGGIGQLRDEPALAIHLLRSIGDRFHRAITVAPAATR